MNSPSVRNRWPWTDQSAGASTPNRQCARKAAPCPRPWAVGQHLARLMALALGVWLLWAPPSSAFYDSAPDPQEILRAVEAEEQAYYQQTGRYIPATVRNLLVLMQRIGSPKRATNLVWRLMQQYAAGDRPSSLPETGRHGYPQRQADPEACQKAQQEYEKCKQEARENLNADTPRFTSYRAMMTLCEQWLRLSRNCRDVP
jgi:hypothetical protein